MKKIVIASNVKFTEEAVRMMEAAAVVAIPADDSEASLFSECRDADAVIIGPRPFFRRDFFESASRVKHIARVGVGVDNVDLKAATESGVFVTNTPEITADSVAEFSMALLLALAKNIPRCDRTVKNGRWNERAALLSDNIELNNKVHGIVGLGKIGKKVAVRCKAFGMKILYFKRSRDLEFENTEKVQYVPFETLLKESDSISFHLPLTNETLNLIDKPQFEIMKPTVLLVNQARGRVINEAALIQALKADKIGGYATDVYDSEPPDPDGELLQFKNVVSTPHLAGSTRESRKRSSLIISQDVLRVFNGEPPINLVNTEVRK